MSKPHANVPGADAQAGTSEEIAARLDAKGHEIARKIADELGMLLWVKEVCGMPAEELRQYAKIAGDMAKVSGVIVFYAMCLSETLAAMKPQGDTKSGE